jgi:hypothetical protein
VFLGIKSQALPLSLWILIAFAAGALTSGILQLLSYLSRRPLIARIRQLEGGGSPSSTYSRESRQTADTPEDSFSDWDDENVGSGQGSQEDWDDYEQPSSRTSSAQDVAKRTNFETAQEPKTSSQSGSVYSYSYREPSNSGVGKTEAVYDANFRVITPPYRKPVDNQHSDDWDSKTESKAEDDEDWGFDDDDEFEEEDKRDRSPRRS